MTNRVNGKFAKKEAIQMSEETNGTAEVKPINWLSVAKGAPEYTGRKRMAITKAIGNAKFASIFTPDQLQEKVYHPDFPPVAEVSQEALDKWLAATVKLATGSGMRAARGDARRWDLRMPDSIMDRVKAVLAPFEAEGLVLTTSYAKYKKEQAATADAPEPTTESENDALFEQELVEA